MDWGWTLWSGFSKALVSAVFFCIANCAIAQSPASTTTGLEGIAAQWELNSFGQYLESGKSVEIRPFHRFNLAIGISLYQINQQHKQVLRLCTYSESIAETDQQRQDARDCQRIALTGLGRYTEAERLAYLDGQGLPVRNGSDLTKQIIHWRWYAELNMSQGNTSIAERSFLKVLELIAEIRKQPTPDATNIPELAELRTSMLIDAERDSRNSLARIAYYQQRYVEYKLLVRDLLDGPTTVYDNWWGAIALEHAVFMESMGEKEVAHALAARAIAFVKADAGFRDQNEPLSRFEIPETITAALGDERVQSKHVYAWLRLAHAYRLLGRLDEAEQLLDATFKLAQKYLLEPSVSSTLIAAVEEAQALLLLQRSEWSAATALLRQARTRLQGAAMTERSMSLGRRNLVINSPLLSVNAKLLTSLIENEAREIQDAGTIELFLEIATDFSASRADLNTQLAAKTLREPRVDVKAALEREGILIDEMIELRGQLVGFLKTSATVQGNDTQGQILQRRLSEIYTELGEIKSGLKSVSDQKGEEVNWRRLQGQLGSRHAFWQWIAHPYANVVMCWTVNGLLVSSFNSSVGSIRKLALSLQQRASLRDVSTIRQLKPYSVEDAGKLYESLFGSLASQVENRDHWILAASPLVDNIPWAALLIRRRADNNAREKTEWLIEKVALNIAPSWSTWLELKERPASQGNMDLLIVGDPDNQSLLIPIGDLHKRGSYISEVLAKPTVAVTLDNGFAREIAVLSSLFPPSKRTVLAGPRATKAKLAKVEFRRYKIIVFSTHGYLGREFTMTLGPSLELTARNGSIHDRFLTASEIARYKLDAETVVLSACDTGASDGYLDSEGYSGLTSAFLLAGARSVVVSLWPVETEATKALITSTLRHYVNGNETDLGRALRLATIELLHNGDTGLHHPSFWASFAVVGR